MRRVVLVIAAFCVFMGCSSKSEAFWWDKKNEPAEKKVAEENKVVVPVIKETLEAVVSEPAKQTETTKELPETVAARESEIKPIDPAVDKKRTLLENRRKQLNNTVWEIEVTLLDSSKKKKKDVITFSNNRFSSDDFSNRGFSATNYTLTIQDNDVVTWETMQTSSGKSGIVFWRGELDADMGKMQGIISHLINGTTNQDYAFSSISKSESALEVEETQE